ncbi:hypothetical protein A3F02_00680 [Candidatus Curtissbacteria bacterium RIFCSPHIGHO2_12_FULL_38_9b]|uniref:Uncharacterized protein n=1 Tax=Candidatus Curtissbacteria bacterium RIFCSPHIGHO2_12_FULL_38_9b TaxID=1797720 RepID=A0A1F5GXF3_9BACT|nr:MAG: hypothetical protein A3F02_00680 [Candidatus Curtissbacteria bacterium RIFCSPHIGHO2_12_FULL_38_9b]
MDPTAPEDNTLPQGSSEPQNPIQPGQFVVAEQKTTDQSSAVPNAPSQPQTQSASPFQTPDQLLSKITQEAGGLTAQQKTTNPLVNIPPLEQSIKPSPLPEQSTLSPLESNAQLPQQPELNQSSVQDPKIPEPVNAQSNITPTLENNQPDPAPYTPPQANNVENIPEEGGSSKLDKMRLIAIVTAAVLLLAIIAAIVWFFVLGKKGEPVKTEVDINQQVEEPPLIPKRINDGFGDLPEATSEATTPAELSPEDLLLLE